MNEDTFDFNDTTSKESQGFDVLPEGTKVSFVVTEFKKTFTQKGYNMAKLALRCETQDGLSATLKDNLVLLRRCEWRINQFLLCVGLRQHGECSVPKWDKVAGSHGNAILGIEKWEHNGKSYERNCIKEYLEPGNNVEEPF